MHGGTRLSPCVLVPGLICNMTLQQRRLGAECLRREHRATTRANAEALQCERLVRDSAAKPRWDRDGREALFTLHLAVRFGDIYDVQQLLDIRADCPECDEDGQTVMVLLLLNLTCSPAPCQAAS